MVKFYRKHNRSVEDVYRQLIQPKTKMLLNDTGQKIATYCKRNHRWQNRRGALEDSISWTPPELKNGRWIVIIFAGGWARVKFAFNYGLRKATGRRRRNVIRQRGERFALKPGAAVYVNYAKYVEKKGYPVLIQGITQYRPLIRQRIKAILKVRTI